MTYFSEIKLADSRNIDAFGRVRTSNPAGVSECQFTYDLKPLIFEQITLNTGATITHDATNRCALMTFASTPTGGKSFMQSYRYMKYQAGKSQLVRITFNFISQVANCLKFVGYSDGVNGIEFQNNGTQNQIVLYSTTNVGNQTIAQNSFNIDKLDGLGASGVNLDITKANHLVIDLQALYVGRVRIGFEINGQIVYCHQFLMSNTQTNPYIQSANLPIRAGMTSSGTVSTTMKFICSSVDSEGGQEEIAGAEFVAKGSTTAANGVSTHLLSLRPKLTFNGITNRSEFRILEIEVVATGSNSVEWELCVGQALTTPTYTDVNTTYSSTESVVGATLSGSPAIVFASGTATATNQSKSISSDYITAKYPITLSASGANRDLGTLTLLVKGIGAGAPCTGSIKFSEIR